MYWTGDGWSADPWSAVFFVHSIDAVAVINGGAMAGIAAYPISLHKAASEAAGFREEDTPC